ncbi:hypothetical protein QAD02_009185 [Eretmocerus hayati]|uniref:Uncharacterized protein n=1 Tax=Eretmocerus hayati TaxID=131215 RepID=A0ACC2N8W1_9HYME|nr:hypothetical protein QAD02_009185 [Eretmocerus hayati]
MHEVDCVEVRNERAYTPAISVLVPRPPDQHLPNAFFHKQMENIPPSLHSSPLSAKCDFQLCQGTTELNFPIPATKHSRGKSTLGFGGRRKKGGGGGGIEMTDAASIFTLGPAAEPSGFLFLFSSVRGAFIR